MEMKEDKILIDIYLDELRRNPAWMVNIGHSTYEENITISLDQARELVRDLIAKIDQHSYIESLP